MSDAAGRRSLSGRPARRWTPSRQIPATATQRVIAATGLAAMATALALLSLLVILVPQRLAQRPAREGVIVLHLDRQGHLRLWNQPISAAALRPVLERAARDPRRPRLRLQPDPGVPWGQVQDLANAFDHLSLPLELQLP